MRFWRYNIVVFFLLVGFISNGQESTLELIKSVSVKGDFIETDNIGNVYVVKGGSVSMYAIDAKFIMKNSALAFGKITTLDATNALKMILYFKDLSQVSYLDNQLSLRGDRIELDVLGYYQTTTVCRSYNEGFWIYDQTTFELTRLTEQLEVSAQSGNLSQVLGYVPDPNYMRESSNWLYVNDPNQGILVFDWYGSYTKRIPIKGLNKFVIRSNRLFYLENDSLSSYNLKTAEFAKIALNVEGVVDFTVFEDNLLLITENELLVYRIIVE